MSFPVIYVLTGFFIGACLLLFGKDKFLPMNTRGIDMALHYTPRDEKDREFVALWLTCFTIFWPFIFILSFYMTARKRMINND